MRMTMKAVRVALMLSLGVPALVTAQDAAKAPSAETTASAAVPLNAETFAALPTIENVALSPTGQFIMARVNADGQQALMIRPLFDQTQKSLLIKLNSIPVDVDWWEWVTDDWILLGVSDVQRIEGNEWTITRLIAVQRTTGKSVQLGFNHNGQHNRDVIFNPRDGTSTKILVEFQRSVFFDDVDWWPAVYEVDVTNNKQRQIVNSRSGITGYSADANGAVRLGYGYDYGTRKQWLIYRPGAEGPFETVQRASARKDETLTIPVAFRPDGQTVLVRADDENGFWSLYETDVNTMALGEKLFGVSGYDIDEVITDPTGSDVWGVSVTEDRDRVHWLNPEMAELQKGFDTSLGAGRSRIVSWSKDRSILLVHVGGPDQPGSYYLFNRAGDGKLQRIGWVDEKLKGRKLNPVTTMAYKARDGVPIRAVVTLPKGKEAKNLPVIMMPHGGPVARDSEEYDWWTQFLASKGYAVIQPNYRGSSGFGTKFQELGEGQWGTGMQDDLTDAMKHFASIGMIDPKRACIVGASYGGYAAMRAAHRDTGVYRCAVSYAGVSDMGRMVRYNSRFLTGEGTRQFLRKMAPDFTEVSPLKFANDFAMPILILHGKKDRRVPVNQSQVLVAKLKAANKPHKYIEQPEGDHFFTREADRLQFLKEMEAWLDTYNPV